MTVHSRRETVTFTHPFRIRGIVRDLPAGAEFTTNFRELREREADLENRTIAASTYRATEFEGTPPGIVLRGIDFRP